MACGEEYSREEDGSEGFQGLAEDRVMVPRDPSQRRRPGDPGSGFRIPAPVEKMRWTWMSRL